MNPLEGLGKILIIFGALMLILGGALLLLPKIPFVGRLPGDIYIRKGNFILYFLLFGFLIQKISPFKKSETLRGKSEKQPIDPRSIFKFSSKTKPTF